MGPRIVDMGVDGETGERERFNSRRSPKATDEL
jgi:hypothetical protein